MTESNKAKGQKRIRLVIQLAGVYKKFGKKTYQSIIRAIKNSKL